MYLRKIRLSSNVKAINPTTDIITALPPTNTLNLCGSYRLFFHVYAILEPN